MHSLREPDVGVHCPRHPHAAWQCYEIEEVAAVDCDARDGIYRGKVLGLTERITFEGEALQSFGEPRHTAWHRAGTS